MPILAEDRTRFFVTVPKQICRIKGWNKGTELYFQFDDKGRVVITEVKKD